MAIKEKTTNQINFDDLQCEGGFSEEYLTLTGKEQTYLPEYDVYKTYECDVGDDLTGYPEVTILPKEGKSYDALRVKVIDETTEEILEAYANFPRADERGFVKKITKDFDFYRMHLTSSTVYVNVKATSMCLTETVKNTPNGETLTSSDTVNS